MVQREDDDATSVESSLDELLQKKAAERALDEEEDEEILDLELSREEQAGLDPLAIRPLPQQANEFTCSHCFLVKHQSQLADPSRNICHDCA